MFIVESRTDAATPTSMRIRPPGEGRGLSTWSLIRMDMADCDLTSKIAGYMDRHLVFPMLEFLSERGVSYLAIEPSLNIIKILFVLLFVVIHSCTTREIFSKEGLIY